MSNSVKNILSGSVWGIIAKVLDSAGKFFSIPMLIAFYDKANFGLVVLAISLNAYLRMMDLGMNIGGVKFFSVWFAQNNTEKIIKVSGTSVSLYTMIGAINAVVFLILGFNAEYIFDVTGDQAVVFRQFMYIASVCSVMNWIGYVVEQLLTSIEQFAWLNQMRTLSSIVSFGSVLLAIWANLTLPEYFTLYSLSTLIMIPMNIARLRKTNISIAKLLRPAFHFSDFRQVIMYSLALFVMGIFQVTSDTIRPILLGIVSKTGVEVLVDYRIIQTIALFVMALGSVFFGILLPISAKADALQDTRKRDMIIFDGTKVISVFMGSIVFGLIINAQYILTIYVGESYSELSTWLIVWLLTVLVTCHTFPVSSFIFAIGHTKPLVWSSAIGCVISIATTVILVPYFEIGGAVIGYLVFVLINNAFTYLYYIPRVLKLDAIRIFVRCFVPILVIGTVCSFASIYVDSLFHLESKHLSMIMRSTIFIVMFTLLTNFLFVSVNDVLLLLKLSKPGSGTPALSGTDANS